MRDFLEPLIGWHLAVTVELAVYLVAAVLVLWLPFAALAWYGKRRRR